MSTRATCPTEYSAHNTAIGAALVLVGIFCVPESIAIVMIIRFLIEAQDLFLGFVSAAPSQLFIVAGFMVAEALVIQAMFRVIAKRHATSS